MGTAQNIEVIREIFGAIERRDQERFAQLCTPDLELHWPPSLPYGGVSRGLDSPKPSWQDTWEPLQPTDGERRMDSRVVAATDEEAVVLWHQHGLSPTGETTFGAWPVTGTLVGDARGHRSISCPGAPVPDILPYWPMASTVDSANHGHRYVRLGAGWYEPERLACMVTRCQSCAILRLARGHISRRFQ
jgi:ketosteroid isomerase-like protein